MLSILGYSIIKRVFSKDLYFYHNRQWQKVRRPDEPLNPIIAYSGQILSVKNLYKIM